MVGLPVGAGGGVPSAGIVRPSSEDVDGAIGRGCEVVAVGAAAGGKAVAAAPGAIPDAQPDLPHALPEPLPPRSPPHGNRLAVGPLL